ncbi:MAG: hypothetical protein N0A00_04205 [Candidatus Bathyarchaeota archaeon]|nr:hypothetical protein [Candidatus Bathyarchaeota archaeon]
MSHDRRTVTNVVLNMVNEDFKAATITTFKMLWPKTRSMPLKFEP